MNRKADFTIAPVEKKPLTTLELKTSDTGLVELWGHTAVNGFRIAHFEQGTLIIERLSTYAIEVLGLATDGTQRILTRGQ